MNHPPLRLARRPASPHPPPAPTACRSSPRRSMPSPGSAPPAGPATPPSTCTPWPASSPRPSSSCPKPSTTHATRNSPGPRSANSPAPPPPPQHAATGTNHDQLDKDHRHNAADRASPEPTLGLSGVGRSRRSTSCGKLPRSSPWSRRSLQRVTGTPTITRAVPPLWAGHRLEVDHEADAQIWAF
jgi:hypothetical protein